MSADPNALVIASWILLAFILSLEIANNVGPDPEIAKPSAPARMAAVFTRSKPYINLALTGSITTSFKLLENNE